MDALNWANNTRKTTTIHTAQPRSTGHHKQHRNKHFEHKSKSSNPKSESQAKIRTKEALKLSLDNSVRLSERNFLAQLVKLDFQRTQVMFDSTINIYEVDDYDRKIEKTWTRLTQLEKVLITPSCINLTLSVSITWKYSVGVKLRWTTRAEIGSSVD